MIGHPRLLVAFGLCLGLGRAAAADEPRPGAKPSPVPVTREDMKRALEDSKHSTPRLPLPPLTEEQKARAAEVLNDARRRIYSILADDGMDDTEDLDQQD